MSKKNIVQIQFDDSQFEKLKKHRVKKGFKTNASYFTSLYVNDLDYLPPIEGVKTQKDIKALKYNNNKPHY